MRKISLMLGLTREGGMSDDRTKADKDWEARQEAARYRIFNDCN
jgi:hypothetical protein